MGCERFRKIELRSQVAKEQSRIIVGQRFMFQNGTMDASLGIKINFKTKEITMRPHIYDPRCLCTSCISREFSLQAQIAKEKELEKNMRSKALIMVLEEKLRMKA